MSKTMFQDEIKKAIEKYGDKIKGYVIEEDGKMKAVWFEHEICINKERAKLGLKPIPSLAANSLLVKYNSKIL